MTDLTDPPATEETKPVTEAPASLPQRIVGEARELFRFLLVAVPAYLAFTTVAFAAYHIPSESMVPAMEVGDRVIVSKFAYGYSRQSLPLNIGALLPAGRTRLLEQAPKRGDVIVFMHPQEDKVMIKRLIGLPGDEIALRDGVLWINGEKVLRHDGETIVRVAQGGALEPAARYKENLPGGVTHVIHEFSDHEVYDEFGPYVVPPRHVFAMGDNRDNSMDSRWSGMGPVPMDNLIGRAETVYFAMPHFGKKRTGVEPAAQRLFEPLARRD
jgi:signal peptidase I